MVGEMFGGVLKYRGATPKIALRKRNEVYKHGIQVTLHHWHTHFRLKHFTNAASREYAYTPRKGEPGSGRAWKGSYTAKKLKKVGHTRPLEYSGESKHRTSSATIKATSKGGRCVLNVPALNFKHPKSSVLAREELVRISPAENVKLAQVYEGIVADIFNGISESESKTI